MGRKVLAAKSGRAACSNAAAGGGIGAKNARGAKSLTQRHKGTEKMKSSGNPWIGDVPEGWEVSRVKHHYELILGKMLCVTSNNEANVRLPYVCAANVHFEGVALSDLKEMWFSTIEVKQYAIREGDLLVVEGGAGAGGAAICPRIEAAVGIQNSIILVRNKNCRDNRYLRYLLEALVKNGYVDFVCNKATIPHFTKDKLGNVPLPLPPLPEQQAIAAYLDEKCGAINAAVAEARKGIEEYKAWKKSLIFEVVTGKRRVGFFNAESKCARDEVVGLPERSEPEGLQGAARRRVAEKMKPSGIPWIGDVPMGWEVRRLKDILARPLQYGASESGIAYDEALPRYIRITDITLDGRLKDKGVLSLTEESASDYILQDQDILLARSGATVGKAFLYEKQMGRAAFAGYLIRATIDVTNALPRFVYYTTLGCGYDDWRNSIAVSATIQNIGADKYNNYSLPMPPLTEQRAIADYLDEKCAAIDAMIAEKEALIADLEAYKKSLIYEVVTGKRRVS